MLLPPTAKKRDAYPRFADSYDNTNSSNSMTAQPLKLGHIIPPFPLPMDNCHIQKNYAQCIDPDLPAEPFVLAYSTLCKIIKKHGRAGGVDTGKWAYKGGRVSAYKGDKRIRVVYCRYVCPIQCSKRYSSRPRCWWKMGTLDHMMQVWRHM